MPTWVQDPVTHKLIPKADYHGHETNAPVVHGDIEPFISPITKEVISDRGQLRRHNKKHGVTDSRDYSPEFMKSRSDERNNDMYGKTHQARGERREIINQALRKVGY